MSVDGYPPHSQEMSYHLQNISVTPGRVVEPGCIDKGYQTTIQHKRRCDLYDVGAGAQSTTDSHLRTTNGVDELHGWSAWCVFGRMKVMLTVVLPLPVAPMTLRERGEQ